MNSKHIILFVAALAAAGGLILAARDSGNRAAPGPATLAVDSRMTVDSASHDFGSISMAAGTVRHTYTISNQTDKPVTLTKLYTSCMCTTATLTAGDASYGPFGMPGHGLLRSFDTTLAPGDTATIEAVFDPAAHGPAGLGRVSRTITLETLDGTDLQMAFTATVTP